MRVFALLAIAVLAVGSTAKVEVTGRDRFDDEDVVVFPGNLIGLGDSNDQFSTLMALLRSVDLDDDLAGPGPFTIFAPTNSAFDALGGNILEYLGDNADELTKVLLYHVVGDSALLSIDLENGTLTTLEGGDVEISGEDSSNPNVNQAKFVFNNGITSNGIAHGIDSVLIPASVLTPACPDTCCCECCAECTGKELNFDGCHCECEGIKKLNA